MPEKYFAYVDETGDLGDLSVSPKASPHFGMAAIVFPASAAGDVRQLITDLKGEFKVPHDKPFSWKECEITTGASMLPTISACWTRCRPSTSTPIRPP